MKNIYIPLLAVSFTFLLCTSCKSTKGCGLTSDASKIENVSSATNIVAEVK